MSEHVQSEVVEPVAHDNLLVAVVGLSLSGKTTLSRYLDSTPHEDLDARLFEADRFREVHVVPNRNILRWNGYDGDLDDTLAMRAFHRDLRANGQAASLYRPVVEGMHNSLIVVDGIRHIIDYQNLVELYGGVAMGLQVEREVRLARFPAPNERTDDAKHRNETADQAFVEDYGDPSDEFASNTSVVLEAIPSSCIIDAAQPLGDVLRDGRIMLERLALQASGLEVEAAR